MLRFGLFAMLLSPFGHILWQSTNSSISEPMVQIAEPCGIWALRILLLNLAMTPLQMITGICLKTYRRMVGLFSFFYASIHVVVWWLNTTSVVNDISQHGFIMLGLLAFVLMTLLAITSINHIRDKMGKYWYYLHRFNYLILCLAIGHFYWQAKLKFELELLVYASIAGLILLVRVFSRNRLSV